VRLTILNPNKKICHEKLKQLEPHVVHASHLTKLSKRVTRPNPAWPTTSWLLSEPTQPDSLINEPKKFKPDPTHHGLVG